MTDINEKLKNEIAKKSKNELSLRKRPFELYKVEQELKIVNQIKNQLTNIPSFIEELKKNKEFALDLPLDIAKKIANNELQFMTKKGGEVVAVIQDATTKRIFKFPGIKELPIELGPSIAQAGLSARFNDLSEKMEEIGNQIGDVNRSLILNRYAEVQSTQEKYLLAMRTKDSDTKKDLLKAALVQSVDAKNLLLNQLYETKNKLGNAKASPIKDLIGIGNNLKTKKSDDLSKTALEDLKFLKDAVSFQFTILAELGEIEALRYEIEDFNEIIELDFSGDNALSLDEYLEDSSNPFKYLSEDVVKAAEELIDFIDENEELLEMHIIPNVLLKEDEKNGEYV